MSVVPETKSPIRPRRISAVSPRPVHTSGPIRLALPISKFRRTATRMTVSMGIAVLLAAPVAPVSSASATDPPPDRTALILGGTTAPTPDDGYIDIVKNQYIAPTYPGQDIDYVAVTTPEEFWPITGAFRLLGLALGDPRIFGPAAAAWPDEPLWKLSGLFDLTADQSLRAGADDLMKAIAAHGDGPLVIYGLSQGAGVANEGKRRLAAQYPAGTEAPDIDFVLQGDPNLPNGGLVSRFPGLYIPILDLTFNGPALTDTSFHTVEINRQYDGFSDFPLYPLNVVADLNAVFGVLYLHTNSFDVSLADDPETVHQKHGDTDYYFFESEDLPLFAPLRTLGVPESVIDVFEPFVREVVELGYDRSIQPWEPTPARLIPPLNPAKVTADLVNAIGEGISNAATLFGLPSLLSIPAAPGTDTAPADTFQRAASMEQATETTQINQTTSTETPTLTNPATSTKKRTQTDQATLTEAGTQTNQNKLTPPNALESSTTISTSQPGKPADTPATPGPVVRGTVGAFGQQNRGLPHRGNGDQPPTQTAAVGNVHTTRGPSSSSSPSAGSSPRSNSPGGDADGS
jgi:hypothetical protein